MGSVTTRDSELHQRIKATHMRMGWGVGANDAELVLRSLPTLHLRYDAQDKAGRALARWLQRRPRDRRCAAPALEGSPGHAHWAATCSRAAGLFSVVFDPSYAAAQVDAFVDALQLFKIGYSWAGPVSLAVPYQLSAMRTRPAWTGSLVRFSLGLEDVDDLIADCARRSTRSRPADLQARGHGCRSRSGSRSRNRIVRPLGVIVNDISSSGSAPSTVATLSISKRPSSVARAIFISSIAS